jgi:hypothetical protein
MKALRLSQLETLALVGIVGIRPSSVWPNSIRNLRWCVEMSWGFSPIFLIYVGENQLICGRVSYSSRETNIGLRRLPRACARLRFTFFALFIVWLVTCDLRWCDRVVTCSKRQFNFCLLFIWLSNIKPRLPHQPGVMGTHVTCEIYRQLHVEVF